MKAAVRGPDFTKGQWESAEDFEQWRTVIKLSKRPLRTLGKNFKSAYCGRKKCLEEIKLHVLKFSKISKSQMKLKLSL